MMQVTVSVPILVLRDRCMSQSKVVFLAPTSPHPQLIVRTIDQQLYQQLYNGNVNQFFVIHTYSEADYRQ